MQLLGASLAHAERRGLGPGAGVGRSARSYRPIVFLVGIALVLVVTVLVAKRLYHGRTRRAPPWDCGFAAQDARMQDTAEGFGQPIRHIFDAFFSMQPRAAVALRRASRRTASPSRTASGACCTCRSRARCKRAAALVGPAADGPHLGVPGIQLRHADRAAGDRAVNAAALDHPAVRGGRGRGARAAVPRLGQHVPRLAAEPPRAAAHAALPHDPQAVAQGRGDRARTPRRCSCSRPT